MLYDQGLTHRLYRLVQDGNLMLYQFTRVKERYKTACHLSQGPNPNRAAHWEKVATGLRRRIEAAINGDDGAREAIALRDPKAEEDEALHKPKVH